MHKKKPGQWGDHKVRTMARSILPSRRDKSSRDDKRYFHKLERTKVRQALGKIWDLESAEDCEADLWHTEDIGINYTVYDRQAADNLNHFIRWAKAVTAHIEDEQEKYWHIKKLMPDTLPGRHSLTHLPWDKYYDPHYYGRFWRFYRGEEVDPNFRRLRHYLAVHKALYDVCASAYLTEFNNHVRFRWATSHRRNVRIAQYKWDYEYVPCEQCATPRLLKGSHDIDDFLCHDYGWHRHEAYETIKVWLEKNEFLK